MRFFLALRTVVTWSVLALVNLFFGLLAVPLVFLPASVRYDNRLYYFLSSWWSRICLWIGGVRVTVTGAEALPTEPCVIAMNHASALDILVIERLLGSFPRVWLSRMAYRRVPVLGSIMKRMHVVIDLRSSRAAVRGLARLISLVRDQHRHALIFPEGGRHTDGKIHEFFRGFAVLARKLDRPVQAIYIANAHRVLDPTGYLIDNRHSINIVVGPQFVIGEQTDEEFIAQVRDWFVQHATATTK